MDLENENGQHRSQLPRASYQNGRSPSPSKMKELSACSINSINKRKMEMPPPPVSALKQRKTLAERAGEPSRLPSGAYRQSSTISKGTALATQYRQPSFSSSVSSSRPSSSTSSRNMSSGSFTSNMSAGSRPQSALAASRLQRPQSVQGRPLSALESQSGRGLNSRNGRTQFSSTLQDCHEHPFFSEAITSHDTQSEYTLEWASLQRRTRTTRDISLSKRLGGLSLEEKAQPTPKALDLPHPSPSAVMDNSSLNPSENGIAPMALGPNTPSHIPRVRKHEHSVTAPSPFSSPSKTPKKRQQIKFLTRDSNTECQDFDVDDRLAVISKEFDVMRGNFEGSTIQNNGLKDMIAFYKNRATELEAIVQRLTASNENLKSDLNDAKQDLFASSMALEESKRRSRMEVEDLQRQHRRDLEDTQQSSEKEIHSLERQHLEHQDTLKKQLQADLEEERAQHQREVQALNSKGAKSQQEVQDELERLRKSLEQTQEELQRSKAETDSQQNISRDLRGKLSEAASSTVSLESSIRSLRAHVEFLESDNKSQSHAFSDLDNRLQNAIKAAEEAKDKLRTEETLRRKLHNQVQELKGNIRVFCRVRPSVDPETDDAAARITFPDDDSDAKEIEVLGPEEKNSLGKISTKTNAFSFDRVFTPAAINSDVFGEISQLVQSALDGYNVCIFCYGQTGSGKTYTMSAQDGMIPQAVHQIYDTARSLEEKGWRYNMEGSFIEVYNENLNDLLGKPDELDKKKHEIRHDMQKCKTIITDITTVQLDGPSTVESILRRAASNRSVAATKANERSSRSHSVFILKLTGENSTTGERSEGTLNLVDLAGSERLSQSQATGDRLKETQNINKSLSCLGDVIGALGQGKEGGHVPYRNSKLTYLLQFSLGGNSKTLMFVMISPLQAHLSETLTSLKFATKVHNTHIGTAKRQAKTRDS